MRTNVLLNYLPGGCLFSIKLIYKKCASRISLSTETDKIFFVLDRRQMSQLKKISFMNLSLRSIPQPTAKIDRKAP